MKICEKENCSGCGACYNICPKNAITMGCSSDGFLYPVIDQKKCINCGLCQKTCPNNSSQVCDSSFGAYLFKNKDDNIRKRSSSGGFFSEIAKIIIDENGVVFGAEFDTNYNIQHHYYEDLGNARRFCTSKYVQSDIKESFRKVYTFLNEGRKVLFSGTPCQVSGLMSYLSSRACNTQNLITIDFICHGVASPKFWQDCLTYYSKKYKSSINYVNFRGKTRAGKLQNLYIKFQNGKKFIAPSTNLELFYYHFLKNYILRESCYKCKYSRKERVSDITLADCFKAKDEHKYLIDGFGLSFVMVNSEKGRSIIEKFSDVGDVVKVDINDYIQPNLSEPTPKPSAYSEFWETYNDEGFISALVVSGYNNLKNQIKNCLFKFVFILRLDDFIKRIKK